MTLVVNLFGGPGVSKSTTAALMFGTLKSWGVNAEIAHEYAKDLTWEDRQKALRFQPYVAAKQMYRVHRLIGQVDVVVTDSPILLSLIYKGEGYSDSFAAHVLDVFRSWNTFNFYLQRNELHHPYSRVGRSQTEDEAKQRDTEIWDLLVREQIPTYSRKVGQTSPAGMASLVYEHLKYDYMPPLSIGAA